MSPTGSLSMRLRLRVFEAEPDGSACIGCGDRIFLAAYELAIFGFSSDVYLGTIDGLLCQSCGEAIKSETEVT